MKKLFLLVLLTIVLSHFGQAQYVKALRKGNLIGLNVVNDAGAEIKRLEPAFEDIEVYTRPRFVTFGEVYVNVQFFNDTEFIEVPIDPSDYTRTKTDTIVSDSKLYFPGKLVLAKKGGKWGLITIDGEEKAPFDFEAIYPLNAKSMQMVNQQLSPFFLTVNQGKLQILDQTGSILVPDEKIPSYFKNRNKDLTIDAMEISYFGDYFLVNEGGTLFDTIIKVPAVKKVVNGKTKIITPAYQYSQFWYKGGKLNVWQFSTNNWVFPEAHKNVEIYFQDDKGTNYFESLNVRSLPSIYKFQENSKLGLVPARIVFVPTDK
jgi:hypothetical protein